MDYSGRVAVVTGASSGIGRQLALDLARRGATVSLVARGQHLLEEALREVRRSSPNSSALVCDVGERAQVDTMARSVLERYGRIDILVNNAGIGERKTVARMPVEEIEEIMRVNYLGMVYCTKAFLPAILDQKRGHIVNVASVAGKVGTPKHAAYCASKFAMVGFTEGLYHELRSSGIQVHLICPGPVSTNFTTHYEEQPPRKGRIASAAEVSRAILRAIERGGFETTIPWEGRLIDVFKAVLPGPFRWAVQKLAG